MRNTWFLLPALLLVLAMSIGCDSPVAPSRSSETPGGSSVTGSTGLPGRPIAIGQTVEADLQTGSNLMCEFGDDPYPCGRYLLVVPRPGRVTVRMDFVGGDIPMFIAFETPTFHASRGNFVAIGKSPLTASVQASPGQLTLAVGVDAPYGSRPNTGYRFRFVTTLE